VTDFLKVLAIDGGGIRGIIPALVLSELERRTHRPVAELFDLVAGTSTGGIIALGVSMPGERGEPVSRAAHIIDIYEKAGTGIFAHERFSTMHALLHERYPSEDIDATLAGYFGETPLSAAVVDVAVTAYDMVTRNAVVLRSADARRDASLDLPMRVAARATSAAPTYFEPVAVTLGDPPREMLLVDGAVCANNPAMVACVDAQRRRPGAPMFVVSLGTGQSTTPLPPDEVREWGLAHWSRVILHLVVDGASEMAHLQLRELLTDHRYHRLQTQLLDASESLDDATADNIDRLRTEAERLIADRDAELDAICTALVR
jgi:patatin-like phospholipase/acyl hydrolase